MNRLGKNFLWIGLFAMTALHSSVLWGAQTQASKQDDPWNTEDNLGKMGSDLKELFEDFLNKEAGELRRTTGKGFYELSGPAVDMRQVGQEIVVECDVPGWDKRDVSVELLNNILIIRGKKPQTVDQKDYFIHERFHDQFERQVTLPAAVTGDKVKAEHSNGVLTVRLPLKNEVSKSVKVKIV